MTLLTPCPIWGMNVEEVARDGSALTVDSPRAGGKYKISGPAGSMADMLPSRDKAIVTSWLVEQRRSGIGVPEIRPDALEDIRRRRPLRFSERAARLLRYCESNISKIGEAVSCVMDDGDPRAEELMAVTECQDAEELSALILLLSEAGLIKDDGGMGFHDLAPTPSGWLQIDEMQSSTTEATQAFVAMWFNQSTEAAYREGGYRTRDHRRGLQTPAN